MKDRHDEHFYLIRIIALEIPVAESSLLLSLLRSVV